MLELKLMRRLKNEPYSEYVLVGQVSVVDLKKMYSIYEKYYDNTRYSIFETDFLAKTGVFLIRHPKTNEIVGFSTVTECDIEVKGKIHHAFFSGDTVIEKEFWGNRALQRACYRFIIQFKMRYPTEKVYWILISKGFKTYLLLANNYYTYYPHHNGEHQHLQALVDGYCKQYFEKYYDTKSGLLNFGDDYQPLNEDVAPITEEMRAKNPKINFFEQLNPTWKEGTELPCIGEITWRDLSRYVERFLNKATSLGKQPTRPTPQVETLPTNLAITRND